MIYVYHLLSTCSMTFMPSNHVLSKGPGTKTNSVEPGPTPRRGSGHPPSPRPSDLEESKVKLDVENWMLELLVKHAVNRIQQC